MCRIGVFKGIVQKKDVNKDYKDYFVVKVSSGWEKCVDELKKNYDDVDVGVVRNRKWQYSLRVSVDEFKKYVNRHINKNGEVKIPVKAFIQGKTPVKGDELVADAHGLKRDLGMER